MIFHLSRHGAFVNSAALNMADVDENTRILRADMMKKDENGGTTQARWMGVVVKKGLV